jgi:AraC family transcriptional regulator
MKPRKTSTGGYFARIDRIISRLNEQIDGSLSLEELAAIAGVSPFHFHRLYRAMTGETPSGTLRRLRLARAAGLLRDSSKPVTEIAFDAGYESSQAFSKAFRRETGCSASELRRDPARLDSVIRKLSSPPERADRNMLEVRLVSVEPFKVIASRHVGPQQGLFEAYGALFSWGEKAGHVQNLRGIYGVPVDDPGTIDETECRFDCCFDFGAGVTPSGDYAALTLGGGLYAVTRHVGPYEGLLEKSDYLYGTWLPASGYLLRNDASYNHYLADPASLPPEEWETDVYVPVEKAG